MLIIIEGLDYSLFLNQTKDTPIVLNLSNRLIYSGHFYSWSVNDSLWNGTYEHFRSYYDSIQGFVTSDTPLWIGEFGTNSKC